MARIEGLTIEIGVDAKRFNSGIKSLDKNIAKAKTSLTQVNKALHFNPGNTELIKQKQQLLGRQIEDTKSKLTRLRQEEDRLKSTPGFDENSEDARRLRREIIETESKLKSLNRQASQVASVFGVKMQVAGAAMQKIGRSISRVGDSLTMRFTLPVVMAGAKAVKKFAEVDKTMQLTNATMKNTEAEAKLLNDAMKKAAANSTFGMSDAATASLNFARAGLDAAQAASTLAPAMNLAAGEGGNLDTVSGGLVATINGFSDSFDNAGKYADVFANACNNSALDIDSLSTSMSIAAPIFSSAGYSVNDAALYMGVMANKGIKANKAATSLKTGFARLLKPTDEAAALMDHLGISMTDSEGNMKSTIEVQEMLHDSFNGLSKAQKIMAASTIFGKNQMAPWLSLINTAPSEVNKLSEALGVEGTTAEMAESMMSGFGGSLEKLKSSIDVAATSLGEALAPTIRKVADKIQAAVDAFNDLSEEEQQTIAKTILLTAAAGPLLAIGGRMISGIGVLTKGLGKFITGAAAVAKGTATLGTTLGVVGVAALGAVAGFTALYKASGKAAEAEYGFTKEEKEQFKALTDATKAYKEAEAARDENTQKVYEEFGLIDNLVGEYNSLIDSNGKVKKGYENRAAYIKGELAEALGIEESEIDKLIEKNGKLGDSIAEVIAIKRGQAILEANEGAYTQALNENREAAGKLGSALVTLNEKKKEQAAAEKELNAAQAQGAKDLEVHGQVLNDTVMRINEAQDAYNATTNAVEGAQKKVDGYSDTLKKTQAEIDSYDGLMKAVADKDAKAIKEWENDYTKGLKNRTNATKDELTEQAKIVGEEYKALKQRRKEGDEAITDDILKTAKKRRDYANEQAGLTAKDAKKNEKKIADAQASEAEKGAKKTEKAFKATEDSAKRRLSNMEKTASQKGKAIGDAVSRGGAAAKVGMEKGMSGAASSASSGMNKASSAVAKGISNIKGKFPFNVGNIMTGSMNIPDIVIDRFKNIAGASIPVLKGALHYFGFAKGYENPMLFTSPALYGGAVFGDRGNHAGGEMVYGRENLMRDIQQAVGVGRNIYITVNESNNPRQTAQYIAQELEIATRAIS